MTRLVSAEFFKLRSTRTFYGVVGGALALVVADRRPRGRDGDLASG